MKSGLAVEVIIVMVGVLDLDGDVLKALVVLQFVLNLSEGLERMVRCNVGAASIFSRCQGPDVEIVNFDNTCALLNSSLNLFVVNISGSGFHKSENARLNSRVGSAYDNNGEDEGDKRIGNHS